VRRLIPSEGPAPLRGFMQALFAVQQQQRRPVTGLVASGVAHVLLASVLFTAFWNNGGSSTSLTPTALLPSSLVWLNDNGPGGGGGGGGNRMPQPSRQARLRGQDQVTVPAAGQSALHETKPDQLQMQQLDVPVRAFAASDFMVAGGIEAAPDGPSKGPGDRGGADTGSGGGIGPDDGIGLGPGGSRGTGGDIYRPGSGVAAPVAIYQEKPQYTLEAMRAKIQGAVLIECVVQTTGVCSDLRVVRSLDSRFGLDQQALRAAALWRFLPGTRMGKPVAVVVTIQMGFSIH
jgi:protein TonB